MPSSLPVGAAAASAPERRDQGGLGRFSPGVVRRMTRWIQGWHGGQLLTFWAGAAIVPWQIGFWREMLFRNRFEGFLDPARRLAPAGRIAEITVYLVLPVLVLLVTAVWAGGRLRREPHLRG